MSRRGKGLVDGNVDGGEFGAGHTCEGQEMERGVDDGDVHAEVEGAGVGFAGGGGELGGGEGEVGDGGYGGVVWGRHARCEGVV